MSGSLFLGSPPGQPAPLSLDTVEADLRHRHPDAIIRRLTSAVTGDEELTFAIRHPDGVQRSGLYTARGALILNDGAPTDWASTIASLLAYVPPQTPLIGFVEDNPEPVPVPDTVRSPEAIAGFFEALEE